MAAKIRGPQADAVYWNHDYEPAALERDHNIQQQQKAWGTTLQSWTSD